MKKAELNKLLKQRPIFPDNSNELRQILLCDGKFFPCQVDAHKHQIALEWKRRTRPQKKRCYYNAQKFAKENLDVDIGYWEGVILLPSISSFFLHAWNTIGDDLIDFTLPDKDKSYLGVQIDRYFLFDFENGRWEFDEPVWSPGGFLLEYYKNDRYKEYPLPGTEV